jgi:hypothetical protein
VRIGASDRRDGGDKLSMGKGWIGDSMELRSSTGKCRLTNQNTVCSILCIQQPCCTKLEKI